MASVKKWTLVFSVFVAGGFADLPPEVRKDIYLQKMESLVADSNFTEALNVLEKVNVLQAQGAVVSASNEFLIAQIYLKNRHHLRAKASLEKYLTGVGKSGLYYNQALKLYAQAEEEIEASHQYENQKLAALREQQLLNEKEQKEEEERQRQKRIFEQKQRVWEQEEAQRKRKEKAALEEKIANIESEKRRIDKFTLKRAQQAEYQKQMQVVEGGCFLKEGQDSTQKSCVKTFKIDQHEVTQGEYKRVMGDNPSYFKDCGKDCPVEQVDWFMAREYCNRIGKNLPTEEEWIFAAGGGTKSKRSLYSGSNYADSVAWYAVNSGNKTHIVCSLNKNELGLCDMSGNVWEWNEDLYKLGSSEAGNSDDRVNHGGGWYDKMAGLNFQYRGYNSSNTRSSFIGFRCVVR